MRCPLFLFPLLMFMVLGPVLADDGPRSMTVPGAWLLSAEDEARIGALELDRILMNSGTGQTVVTTGIRPPPSWITLEDVNASAWPRWIYGGRTWRRASVEERLTLLEARTTMIVEFLQQRIAATAPPPLPKIVRPVPATPETTK